MSAYAPILSYLKTLYGPTNVSLVDDRTAMLRIKGKDAIALVDLAAFVPFQTKKDDDARSHA